MNTFTEYTVPFSSLKPGKNHLNFTIGNDFFKEFELSDIQKAKISVELIADKLSAMVVFDFLFNGSIVTECDRCTDDLSLDISSAERLIVKFGDESFKEETDDILVLPHGTQEINLAPYIYEFIHLSLPVRKAHEKETECNQLVLKKLEEFGEKQKAKNKAIDPRWEVLKNVKI